MSKRVLKKMTNGNVMSFMEHRVQEIIQFCYDFFYIMYLKIFVLKTVPDLFFTHLYIFLRLKLFS